jgi:hypothetical protein
LCNSLSSIRVSSEQRSECSITVKDILDILLFDRSIGEPEKI